MRFSVFSVLAICRLLFLVLVGLGFGGCQGALVFIDCVHHRISSYVGDFAFATVVAAFVRPHKATRDWLDFETAINVVHLFAPVWRSTAPRPVLVYGPCVTRRQEVSLKKSHKDMETKVSH
jgi:hypothetical protein